MNGCNLCPGFQFAKQRPWSRVPRPLEARSPHGKLSPLSGRGRTAAETRPTFRAARNSFQISRNDIQIRAERNPSRMEQNPNLLERNPNLLYFRESRLFNGLSPIPADKAFAFPFSKQGPAPSPAKAPGRACPTTPAAARACPISIVSIGAMITPTLIFQKQMFEILAGPPLPPADRSHGDALRPEFDRPSRQTCASHGRDWGESSRPRRHGQWTRSTG